jgi:acetyl esterase/lipase
MKRVVAVSLLSFCMAALPVQLHGQTARIMAEPADALIDAPVRIVLSGFRPAQKVIVRSVTRVDSADAVVASGVYFTDRDGVVDLTRDAARSGTYTGIEAMGLLWSGRRVPFDSIAPAEVPRSRFDPPQPFEISIVAVVNDTVVARTSITRRFSAATVVEEEVRQGDVIGRLFIPRDVPRPPAIIVVGGSEGGYESSSFKARLLAAHGFAVFAQAYFRAPGLPDELASVPVERVQRGVAWLRQRSDVSAERLAIIGTSRGSELALLSAGLIPQVRAVVVFGTSVTTGGGLTRSGEPRPESAWTIAGQPTPVVQFAPSPEALAQFSRPDPVRLRLLFEPALSDVAAIARAAIPVDNIRGDVLIISGIDDQMGPVDIAGDIIVERLARAGHRGRRIHLKYPEAGHLISTPFTPVILRLAPWRFAVGGNVPGYARADADSWKQLLQFLRTSLQ